MLERLKIFIFGSELRITIFIFYLLALFFALGEACAAQAQPVSLPNSYEAYAKESACAEKAHDQMQVEILMLPPQAATIWRLCKQDSTEPVCLKASGWWENLFEKYLEECINSYEL